MKKMILGGLLVALATSTAAADTVTLAYGSGSLHDPLPGAPGTRERNRGGQFLMSGALGNFQSFCLEYDEIIGERSYFYSIDTHAIAGGLAGGNPDPLGRESAELYRRYLAGDIGPAVGQTFMAFNNAVQDAFWFLEEELGEVDFTAATAAEGNSNYAFMSPTAQSLVDLVWGTTASVGKVRVLNLYNITTGANRQSILYMVAIPLPSAGAMALAGLFGVAAVRRRRAL